MFSNYQDLTSEQLREKMLDHIPADSWEALEKTPQNINWMFVVYNIENCDTKESLEALLDGLEHHYAGPISIHEGWVRY